MMKQEDIEDDETYEQFEQFKMQKLKDEQEKEARLQEERKNMQILSPEELKKLPVKERMAYKQKLKGFEDYKPQEVVKTEEDYLAEYLVQNYQITLEQAYQYIAQQKYEEEQQQLLEKKSQGLGAIQLGKKQNKKKDDPKQKKKPVLFQRLIKQLEGQQKTKEVVKKKEVVKIEEMEMDNTKFVQVDEQRQPLNIVFIGHVDAGKSTICGNILYYSGMVEEADIRKFKSDAKEKNRESWFLAYIMDTSENERNKGITVEVGKAFFQTPTKRYTILDAPGHKNYVPDMIQGAAQADIAALVISSKVGEFEAGFDKGGQTKEHSMLARCLGVKQLIVVINKMDDDNWSQDRFNFIKSQLDPFLKESCGFDIEKDVKYVPISGLNGDNIKDRIDPKLCSWYNGPSFFEVLDQTPAPKRDENGPLRIPILDKFKDQGVFINGKIEQGTIRNGQQVMLMPYRKMIEITHIFNAEDNRVMYAKPGENIKLKIKGVEEDDIMRGMVICDIEDNKQCYVANDIEVQLQVLELPEHKKIFSPGFTCVLHLHTALEEIEVTHVNQIWDEQKKVWNPASYLKSGTIGRVRARCENYLCVDKYEQNEHMGGFTLRDEGRTVALGQIIRLKPVKQENIEELSEEMKRLLEDKKKELAGKKEDVIVIKSEPKKNELTNIEEEDQQF